MVKKESLATKVLTNIGTHPGKWTLGLGAIAYAKLKHSKLKKNKKNKKSNKYIAG